MSSDGGPRRDDDPPPRRQTLFGHLSFTQSTTLHDPSFGLVGLVRRDWVQSVEGVGRVRSEVETTSKKDPEFGRPRGTGDPEIDEVTETGFERRWVT